MSDDYEVYPCATCGGQFTLADHGLAPNPPRVQAWQLFNCASCGPDVAAGPFVRADAEPASGPAPWREREEGHRAASALELEQLAARATAAPHAEARALLLGACERLAAERDRARAARDELAELLEHCDGGDDYPETFAELVEQQGYGALMGKAAHDWRVLLTQLGAPGAEFTVGPCRSSVDRLLSAVQAQRSAECGTPS
ncbi:MAG: hypothetical protein R3F62_08070 [Planctomycetota bacterium]